MAWFEDNKHIGSMVARSTHANQFQPSWCARGDSATARVEDWGSHAIAWRDEGVWAAD